MRIPRQRAFSSLFVTRRREGAKKARFAANLRAFAASRENSRGLSNLSASGG
tara:strand:- start:804 stop:959 length:156 start_codon:yes stop_codon:yes gene_type:complete